MNRPELDIILPVYNEYKTLVSLVNSWHKAVRGIRCRFILCEDGSTDGTKELIGKLIHLYPMHTVMHDKRIGYGPAVRAGMQVATAPFILCIDSDGQCDPADFAQFWKNRHAGDLCIGWRQMRGDSPLRLLMSKLFRYYFRILFPTRLHDPSCPFVLMSLATVKHILRAQKFLKEGFWWGCIGHLLKTHHKIIEIPIHHRLRIHGTSHVYTLTNTSQIAIRNAIDLWRLRFASHDKQTSASLLPSIAFIILSAVAIYGPKPLSFAAFLLLFVPIAMSIRYILRSTVISVRTLVFLTFLAMLLFTIFFPFVARTELWGDEVAVLRMVDGPFREVAIRVPQTHYAIPLFDFWITWIWNHVVVRFPVAYMELLYRLPTMFYHSLATVFFTLLIVGLYKRLRPEGSSHLVGYTIGIVAFLTYFFHPLLLFYATEVKYYSLSNLGVVATLFMYTEGTPFSLQSLPLLLMFGFVSSVEFIILLPLVVMRSVRKRGLWRDAIFASMLIAFYALLIPIFSFPVPVSEKESIHLILAAGTSFMRYAFPSSLAIILIAASAIYAVIHKNTRKYGIPFVLLTLFSVAAISYASYIKRYFDFHPRHFMFISPILLLVLFLPVVYMKNTQKVLCMLGLTVIVYTVPGILRSTYYLTHHQAWARAQSGAYSILRQADQEQQPIVVMPYRENQIVSRDTYQYFYLDNFYWYARKYPTVTVLYPENTVQACALLEANPHGLILDWINTASCDDSGT